MRTYLHAAPVMGRDYSVLPAHSAPSGSGCLRLSPRPATCRGQRAERRAHRRHVPVTGYTVGQWTDMDAVARDGSEACTHPVYLSRPQCPTISNPPPKRKRQPCFIPSPEAESIPLVSDAIRGMHSNTSPSSSDHPPTLGSCIASAPPAPSPPFAQRE